MADPFDKASGWVDRRLNFNKIFLVLALLATVIIAAAFIVRTVKGQGAIAYSQVSAGNEIHITAEDASEGSGEYRTGTLTVAEGQQIVIEPTLKEGGIKVYISLGQQKVYDGTVEGTQAVTVNAAPGTYDVGTLPMDGTTGEMTIRAR